MTSLMSIIKLEIKMPELVKAVEQFKKNRVKSFEQINEEVRSSLSNFFNQVLEAELEIFLGNEDQKENKKNGYIERGYFLKNIGAIKVKVPRDRNQKFMSEIIPKSERIDPRLKEDLAILHLSGISNRTLAMISRRVLGIEVSTKTVQNSLSIIEDQALNWLERDLKDEYWALYVDGTNFQVQRRDSTEKEPTLVVLGIDSRNRRSILALQPGHKDRSEDWGQLFSDLSRRGLNVSSVKIGIMDGLPGLEKKFKEHFPNSKTARCWVHAKKNIMAKVPSRLQAPFSHMLDKVMYASSRTGASLAFESLKKQMNKDATRAITCLEKDINSLLVHYDFEKSLWRSLKTTNPIERVNKELKRRVKSMEGVSEKTLNILLAFTALRLECNWRKVPVDSETIYQLKNVRTINEAEEALGNLIPQSEN